MKTNGKNRSLLLSATAILVSIAMLTGATLAWFTDTETNYGNSIKAGTLDIDVVWYELEANTDSNVTTTYGIYSAEDYNGDLDVEAGDTMSLTFATAESDKIDFDGGDALISEDNWEPGLTTAKLVEVTYSGTLDAKLYLNAIVETNPELEDALWYDFIAVGAVNATSTDATAGAVSGELTARPMYGLSEFVDDLSFTLDPDTANTDGEVIMQFILVYGMNKSAGNTYQGKSYSADIILTATQANADAVGTDTTFIHAYTLADILAVNDDNTTSGDYVNSTIILMNDIDATGTDIALTELVNIDLNGYTLTANSLSVTDDSVGSMDIEGDGSIVLSGAFTIEAPQATINQHSTIYVGSAEFDVAPNTYNLIGEIYVATGGEILLSGETNMVIHETGVIDGVIKTEEDATLTGSNGTEIPVGDSGVSGTSIITVSGGGDALITAIANYTGTTAAVYMLDAGNYTAPTEITESCTIIGAGSTRLGSSDITTLDFAQPLTISTDAVSLTLSAVDLDADVGTNKFVNNYGIIQLKNAKDLALTIVDSYVVEKLTSGVGVNNYYLSASVYLGTVESPTVTIDNSYLLGRYTIMCQSYSDSSGRGYSHDITDAVYTITDSTLQGWTTGNMRGEDTVYTATNCILIGENDYSGTSNSYSTFVMTDGSIDSSYTFNSCTVTASNTGDQEQNCFSFQYGATNNTLYLNDCIYEMYIENDVPAAIISVSNGTSGYPTTSGSVLVLDGDTYELKTGYTYTIT